MRTSLKVRETDRVSQKPETARKCVSLVVPVHNEEEAIPVFLRETKRIFDALADDALEFEYIFVNDGSRDGTLRTLIEAQATYPNIRVVDFSRNFGKEAALTAGLDYCKSDAAIPIDVDLQDPPEIIEKLVSKWREGFEVVVARRVDRSSDSWAKSWTAKLFYRVHNRIADDKLPENVGDFRIMDRIALDALKSLPERRRFMKGLFAWVGFETATVDYTRDARAAGETKFSFKKLWALALEGITSFSSMPLEVWTYVGGLIAIFAFGYGGFIVGYAAVHGISVPGYASLMAGMMFLGGVQLLGIGVLGQYVGRIYSEVKQRPIYVVRKVIESEAN
ncbi:MAG: glycosyltransferase family 2 protein [Pseudomonadota bacterium]